MFLTFHLKTGIFCCVPHYIHQARASGDSPVSISCVSGGMPGSQKLQLFILMYMGSGDSNSGPHTCKASTFTHWAISPGHEYSFSFRSHPFLITYSGERQLQSQGCPVEGFTGPEMKSPASYYLSKVRNGSSSPCETLRWDNQWHICSLRRDVKRSCQIS